jgi:TolB-like protein/class 3 adenylate cyclase/Tfp pilus assembly protein PilF
MPQQKRQLAAIMFTDIVGYTSLMGKDSANALELVRINKEIQRPLVERNNGKWLKEMGDGILAQFNSALDAVNCAIEIQKSARAELEAKLRIGIHLGDVMVQENDVHGDGVNVASRLESITDPGGIYVSDAIEKAIRGQSNVQAKYLGEIKLKNVDYDVRTYALQGVGLPPPNLKEDKNLSGRFIAELQRRGVLRACATYIVLSLLLILLIPYAKSLMDLPAWSSTVLYAILIAGFPIAMYLAWKYERSPKGFVKTTSQQSWQNPYGAGQRKPGTGNFIIAMMAMIIIVLYVGPRYKKKPVENLKSPNEYRMDDKSIAVMPFENLSADEENQYFADGQMEAILNHLTRIADLRVISRTTMMAYKGMAKSIPEIAEDLGVRYILEGSVQKAGKNVRINAQLIDTNSDKHLWSEQYDRNLTDIFVIQTEIATRIASELKATITSSEQKFIEAIPTTNLTAYDFYLKGVDYRSRGIELENARYATQMFQRAVEIDSQFTLAWVGLAEVSRLVYWFHPGMREEYLVKTKEYLDKAIALEPDLMEVRLETGAYYYHCKLDYQSALQILEKLKTEYPNNDSLLFIIGAVYRRMGQFDKAFDYMDRSIALNPSSSGHWMDAANTLVLLRKYTQAEEYYKTAISLDPSGAVSCLLLAKHYLRIGEVNKARELLANNLQYDTPRSYLVKSDIELRERHFDKAIDILDSAPDILRDDHNFYSPKSLQLGVIYHMTHTNELAHKHFLLARKVLEDMMSELQNDSRLYSSLGITYAGLGLRKEALEANRIALSLMNISIDAFRGFFREQDKARTLLLLGDYDETISMLEFLIQQNGRLSIEELRQDPFWDPLREKKAFKNLLENPSYQINITNN